MIHKIELSNGISLEYLDRGKGEVLLLLHGLGSTKADWDYQVDEFAKEFRIIAPDLRGHGNTSKPSARSEYGIDKCARDMQLLLQELGIERCTVVGFSMGGAIAFEMAIEFPDLLSKMVIINTAPDFNDLGEMGEEMVRERTKALKDTGMEPLARQISEGMFPEEDQKQLKNAFFQRACKNPVEAYYNSFITLMEWGIGEKIGQIKIPVLIVASQFDYTPVSLKESYAKKMAHAEVVVIMDSRHGVTMDQPANFNEALLKFFRT